MILEDHVIRAGTYLKPPGMRDKHIVVWLSGGAASAAAAILTFLIYGRNKISLVNNFIAEEDGDNRRFCTDIGNYLGLPVQVATNPKWPTCSVEDVWQTKQYMSGIAGAPCTGELKKEARYHWEKTHPHDFLVLGFSLEEQERFDNFQRFERSNILPILIRARLTKDDCAKFLMRRGLQLPRMYALGYPNANCPGCVKASSPTYWNLVRTAHPDVFKRRATQSRAIGCRLVRYKGKRLFLDELPADATGRPLKSLSIECGIFCEEKP